MSSYPRIRQFVKKLFNEHLLLTNTVTYSGLLALGDCFIQNIEHLTLSKSSQDILDNDNGCAEQKFVYDYRRTGRVFVLGLVLGPLNHAWYKSLDKMVPGHGGRVVGKKILADQFCAAPFFCSSYIAGLGLLEGKSPSNVYAEWKSKFLFIYFVDWFVWPPAQFVNFYFLPTQFRVAYVSMVTLCWNSFLSFVKHKKEEGTPETKSRTQ